VFYKLNTIIIENDCIVSEQLKGFYETLNFSNKTLMLKQLVDQPDISGLILQGQSEDCYQMINAIRTAGPNSWIPIAIISHETMYAPLCCQCFKSDELDNLQTFFETAYKPKILIIEDNEVLHDSLRKILEKIYDLTICGDAESGLSKLEQNHFDLLLTDYMLPGKLDGGDVIASIKNKKFALPIIVMTAFDSKSLELDLLISGANCYLPKPVPAKLLRKTIAETLSVQQHQRLITGFTEEDDQIAWDHWRQDIRALL